VYNKTERPKREEKLDRKQSSRKLRRPRKMADAVDNGLNDYLVETEPEPDEEAMSGCQQRIVDIAFVALGGIGAVVMSIILYYGIQNTNRALLALAFVLMIVIFGMGYHCFLHRHRFWKSLCEICNAEEELQIDP
jgi:hypothetical protein